MWKLFHDQKGFSLVEVLVSVIVVAVVSLALLATVSGSIFFTATADKVYTASILAQARIDLLRKFPFTDLADIAPESDTLVDVDGDGTDDYARTTSITESYNGYTDLIGIKVSVDRIESGSKVGHPVVMETLLARIEEQ